MQPIKPPAQVADGNAEVVALLERWLLRAKEGRMALIAIAGCDSPVHATSEFAGTRQLMFSLNWQLDTLKYQFQISVATAHETPIEIGERADLACYNISTGPACYDFIAWLVVAEMIRRKAGAPAPLKVGFVMQDSDEERAKHEKLRAAFYDGVIIPSLPLMGAVVSDEACHVKPLEKYTFAPIAEMAKAGEEVPLLAPSDQAVAAMARHLGIKPGQWNKRPVTITLREADHMQERNSNLTEWLRVAEYLEAQGERVVFVRDTAKADEPITGFETCPLASYDIDDRMALYEAAKCNLFVSNGPWSLALFGTRPWLMFCEINSSTSYFCNSRQFWATWHGLDPKHDDRYPWSKPTQRIVWKRDDYVHIITAWEELKPLIEQESLQAAE